MSQQIEQWRVQQYQDNVELLVQQRGSKLRGTVMLDTNLKGKSKAYNQLGPTEEQTIVDRHGDTPQVDQDHQRRWLYAQDSNWADLIDQEDKLRLLGDPQSEYVQNGAYALGRGQDRRIIEAFDATVTMGENQGSTKAFPAGQKIAADFDGDGTAEGLTLAKLRRAKTLFWNNDVDVDNPMNKLYCCCTGTQIEDMLGDSTITSADYNAVKALVQGDIDTFMGFTFVPVSTKLLPKSNSNRSVFFYAKSGMVLATAPDIQTEIDRLPTKRYATQVYLWQRAGALRTQEEKVVRALCAE